MRARARSRDDSRAVTPSPRARVIEGLSDREAETPSHRDTATPRHRDTATPQHRKRESERARDRDRDQDRENERANRDRDGWRSGRRASRSCGGRGAQSADTRARVLRGRGRTYRARSQGGGGRCQVPRAFLNLRAIAAACALSVLKRSEKGASLYVCLKKNTRGPGWLATSLGFYGFDRRLLLARRGRVCAKFIIILVWWARAGGVRRNTTTTTPVRTPSSSSQHTSREHALGRHPGDFPFHTTPHTSPIEVPHRTCGTCCTHEHLTQHAARTLAMRNARVAWYGSTCRRVYP